MLHNTPKVNFKHSLIKVTLPGINGNDRLCQIKTTSWYIYLKYVRAVIVDMSEVPIKHLGLLTPRHMSKYYASLLHFKLKHKKLYRSIYNVRHQILFPHTHPSAAAKLELGSWNTQDFVTDENFRLTRRSTHPRSSALIRERDNCWNRCNCRSVSAPLCVLVPEPTSASDSIA